MSWIKPIGFCTVLLALSAQIRGDDWPHYLGPSMDTTWREDGIRTQFPELGMPLIWERPLGGGYSGPAVFGGRVLVMDRLAEPYEPGQIKGNPNFIRAKIPGQERIQALNAITGDQLWEYRYQADYTTAYPYAIGPRCTPTVKYGQVFALGAEGHLHCLEASTGHVLWKRHLPSDYGVAVPEWGYAAHPLVVDNQVICMVGGDDSTVVSFDRHTGQERWRSLSSDKPGYCPPTLVTLGGREQLLVWHGEALAGLNPDHGKPYWVVDAKPLYGMAIGMPRLFQDMIHLMGFNRFSAAYQVASDGFSAKRVWGGDVRKGMGGVLNTAHLDADGNLYSAGGGQWFYCADIRDGQRHWQTDQPLKNRYGDRIGDWPSAFTFHHPPSGQTFIYNDHGEWISATLTPEGYQEHSRAYLMEPSHLVGRRRLVWSAPALAGQRIFLRNDLVLRCYDASIGHPRAKFHESIMQHQRHWVEQDLTPSHIFRFSAGGEVVHQASERSALVHDRPVHGKTLFPIWSMTKPITSLAVMMLLERGFFELDDPIDEKIPAFADMTVRGPDGKGFPLARPITYRHLLLHTSGIYGYDGSFDEEGTWKEVIELEDLESLMDLLSKQPLQHQPGERYTYGLSTAVLGHLIERHTGQSLASFFDQEIFTPLGMIDTRFGLTQEDRQRFQPLSVWDKDQFREGTVAEDELLYQPGSALQLGGEGLVSTLEDYGRFCQMLAQGGKTPAGQTLIQPETFSLMTQDQLGELPGFDGREKGMVLGFGFEILQDPSRSKTPAPAGVFGWGGYHSTCFWIDPLHEGYGLFLTRRYPYLDGIKDTLQEVVYAPEAVAQWSSKARPHLPSRGD
jgi:CubicO group peptidase (beta-lactamase class C family)/outer membrane protein assembly factor BamB